MDYLLGKPEQNSAPRTRICFVGKWKRMLNKHLFLLERKTTKQQKQIFVFLRNLFQNPEQKDANNKYLYLLGKPRASRIICWETGAGEFVLLEKWNKYLFCWETGNC